MLIRNQINTSKLKKIRKSFVSSAYDYLRFDDFLTPDEKTYRLRLRAFCEEVIIPEMPNYLEKQEFPYDIIKRLIKDFPGILGTCIKGYGSAGFSHYLGIAVGLELSRADMSLSMFVMVHGGEVVMKTIYLLGSEEQKELYLPKLNKLELIGAFCLTEPDHGSDAYNIETTVKEDKNGNYVINGKKRWIGQATIADIFIVWAKDESTGNILGFIVEKERKGVSTKKLTGKLSVRSVQNGEIVFDNVVIPKKNKLEKAVNFQNSVSQIFLSSRIGCGWAVAGICIGAYDKVIDYVSKREQFGKTLSSFQLVQEKLARMMGNIQAIMFFCKRMSELYLENKVNIGMAGLCKGWCTAKGRETVSIAREMLGGNGILLEYYVMKAFVDMEALHTAEGTYDINMLLAGSDLTGKFALI